jgi:hypothetical protein
MPETRRILSCDGGGIRGIITLRCLEALEKAIGQKCIDYFDMFAGTSTGSFIAAALADGASVQQLIEIYTKRRKEIFPQNPLRQFFYPWVMKYNKKGLHWFLQEHFRDRTLADVKPDIMITAVDTFRSETTFFSCFRLPDSAERYGAYKQVRLRDAVEASASAPTYFPPHGRFIDGGCTVYNNPSYMAIVEALRYSSDRNNGRPSRYDDLPLEVYSFGTGLVRHAVNEGEAVAKSSIDWAKYVLQAGGDHANYHQSYVAQSELDFAENSVYFYRYDLYITLGTIAAALPGSRIRPEALSLDAVDDEPFGVLDALGRYFADKLTAENRFASAVPPPPETSGARQTDLVRRHNNIKRWVQDPEPLMPPNYPARVLREFDDIDRRLGR